MQNVILKQIEAVSFKGIAQASLRFDSGITCFFGPNGSGKTNLLDAIYMLSNGKSFFNPIDAQNIKSGGSFFMVAGTFEREARKYMVNCAHKKGESKVIKVDKKILDRRSDLIGKFPVVFSSPADQELLNDGSEVRRKYFDQLISQSDQDYMEQLLIYHHALTQRNNLLKQFSEQKKFERESLEAWNRQMNKPAIHIHNKRMEFASKFSPEFEEWFEKLSGNKEEAALHYHSQMNEGDFMAQLEAALDKDRVTEFTSVGVHKDDWHFELNGMAARKFASQGQQKSYLLSLKLAHWHYLVKEANVKPILIIDDVSDKLDRDRLSRLLKIISEGEFEQVFLSDTESERVGSILKELNRNATFISFPVTMVDAGF